ncbi:cell division protein FtsQ/DivIB [Conexibacter sp. SYSU D00693]|uniref:cell division protein FtsQ/DivIB n=1 Tax=Conexibacter sp. SYSU D00693 TaxID=2812560 RepID=UPI00196B6936|nr:cell division protein FtsQ/DivIB [Conexibacter sp. SYSU D00693]
MRRIAKPRLLLGLALTLGLLGGGFLVVRDSSLVAVEDVQVTGLTGPEAGRLSRDLKAAAREMTTLHVDEGALRSIVEPYSVVHGLTVTTDFPHGLRIDVHERTPVAAVQSGSERTLVAGDGTLLRGAARRELAVVTLKTPPVGDRITDQRAGAAIRALAAAPPQLRPKVSRAFFGPAGLTLQLEDGPALRFGGTDRLAAKWLSASRVLADAGSRGATYLDLRSPERPAAGGLEDPLSQTDPEADAQSAATPGVTTPAAPTAPTTP